MSLKTIACAAAVAAGMLTISAQANAADMYAGGMKDAPVYGAIPSWTGFYIGGHVGGAWSALDSTDVDGRVAAGRKWTNDDAGVMGGGQLGYNMQTGNFVFGPEVDLGIMDLSKNQREPGGAREASVVDGGFYLDVTGRLGYALGSALLYAKGGYAYLDGKIGWRDTTAAGDRSKTGLDGWTVGGGVEYAFSPKWSVKAEYQYFDFGATDLHPTATTRIKNELTVNTAKLGLNYHWGNDYTPLK
jgi:outer membrane immunogenic protein